MKTNIKCDICEREKATKNIQLQYIIYDYDDESEEYNDGEISTNEPSESYHLCEECFDDWNDGKISLN